MTEEAYMEYLSARAFGYLLFQRLLGTEPSAELFEAVDLDVARAACERVLDDGTAGSELAELLAEAKGGVETLRGEYTRLFEGPGALPAPPWESVHTSNKRLLMQPSTLEVRAAYRAHGFVPARYPHVPDDHIALELDFLAALAREAVEANADGDDARCNELLAASDAFVDAHLARWVDRFAHDMVEKGRSHYYAGVARTLAAFVEADAAKLKEVRDRSVA